MPLQPDQILSHYRIVGKIGEGGMAVVYRAEDTQLRRHVALKVLPAHLVADAERRRRFLREARAAAAVTHPNITTIYEVDETDGVVFIAMEFVEGKSLRQVIHGCPIPIKDVLRMAIAMAEGLAEAHKARIIHRDLKPDNVMVTTAGHVKLLDFGLAKLLRGRDEESGERLSQLSTVTSEMTVGGKILGTPAYMSPEQLRGQAVDARSDIFSFGATLYEMVTGRPSFKAATVVEILAAVIGAEPKPAGQVNEAVPAELERIIVKCLQKNREARYQDSVELLFALKQLQEEGSGLQARGGEGSEGAGVGRLVRRSNRTKLAAWAAAAFSVAGIALGAYVWRGAPPQAEDPFQSMTMSSITGGSDIQKVVLSPDGRNLAIVRAAVSGGPDHKIGGRWGIAMRQLATGSEVQVLPPQAEKIYELTFSNDGEHVYYSQGDLKSINLYEIPSLGGAGRKLVEDIDSAVGLSPDGRWLAFVRGVPQRNEYLLLTYDPGSGAERVVAMTKAPEVLSLGLRPAWSPDGHRVVTVAFSPAGGGRSRVVAFDAAIGTGVPIGAEWIDPQIDSLAWLGRGGLALSARDVARGFMNQLWYLSWPDGRRRRITNDLNDYRGISVSKDGSTLAALRVSRTSNLWSFSVDGDPSPRQITSGTAGADVIESFSPATNGSIAFTAGDEAGLALWAMRSDGTSRRKISTGTQTVSFNVMPLEGSSAVAFSALGADFVPHVWRMDLDGGNAVQLTRGTGEMLKTVSPDGRRLLYFRTESPNDIWGVPADGGNPVKIAGGAMFEAHFNEGAGSRAILQYSRDGGYIHFPHLDVSPDRGPHTDEFIVPATGGDPIAEFPRPPRCGPVRWAPDGKALTYSVDGDGVSRLMRWPIAGGETVPLLTFREARIEWYQWSPDGRAVVFRARDERGSNLWLWPADGSAPPKPLTNFTAGEIFDISWAHDGRSVYFTQGFSSRDVLVFRGLR